MVYRGTIEAFCSTECITARSTLRNKSKTAKKRLPPALRDVVKDRDRQQCRYCGADELSASFGLQVHHIIYRSEQGQHHESNLITLCGSCHDEVHSDKKRYQPLLLRVVSLTYEGNFVTPLELEAQGGYSTRDTQPEGEEC